MKYEDILRNMWWVYFVYKMEVNKTVFNILQNIFSCGVENKIIQYKHDENIWVNDSLTVICAFIGKS